MRFTNKLNLSIKVQRYTYKIGLTLAETLIVLGIIGVVASLTIPALMKNTNDEQLKKAWKKTYSAFSNATNQIMMENGWDVSNIITGSDDTMRNLYEPFLRVFKTCPEPTVKGICWHQDNAWYIMDGTAVPTNIAGASQLLDAGPAGDILSDGTLVRYLTSACSPGGVCGYILVEVNGFKKPNTIGKDIFGMRLYSNKMIPFGKQGSGGGEGTTCDNTVSGIACSATYLLSD